MTAQPSRLGAVSYELETDWAESINTFGTRLQVLGEPVVPSDIQSRVREPITQQCAEEGKLGVRGPWQGSFTVELALTGHGGPTTGALTSTDLYDLLVNAIGGGTSTQAGTTVATSVGPDEFTVSGGTILDRNLIRVGELGDGRGNGQFVAVDDAATTTLLTALDATANAADVVYAALNVFPLECESMCDVASTRWLLQTANGSWSAHGCFPTSISFSGTNTGEMPRVSITYSVSRWEEQNMPLPNAVPTDAKDGSVVAAGSVFLQNYGDTTRQAFCARSWSLDLTMEVTPLSGPCSNDQFQLTTGAARNKLMAQLSIEIDADATGTSVFNDIYKSDQHQHCLISLSATDGKAVGFYFPNCIATDFVTQSPVDGLNRQMIKLDCLTDMSGATEPERASWRLGMG